MELLGALHFLKPWAHEEGIIAGSRALFTAGDGDTIPLLTGNIALLGAFLTSTLNRVIARVCRQ
jgi:hypothetical protein